MTEADASAPIWRQILVALAMPGLLAIAVAFGGASRADPHNQLGLSLAGAAVIAACIVAWKSRELPGPVRGLIALAVVFVGYGLIQLIPLPAPIWSALSGRGEIAAGFDLAGFARPALPLSLAPESTRMALANMMAPLAALILALTLPWRAMTAYLRWAILFVAAAAALFGVIQAFSGPESGLYPYLQTNRGLPVGFFANVNHQGALMLIATPFAAALAARARLSWAVGDPNSALAMIVIGCLLLIALTLFGTGSMACYMMFGPVAAASILIFRGDKLNRATLAIAVLGGLAIAGIGFALAATNALSLIGVKELHPSLVPLSRGAMAENTLAAAATYWPFGSGLGSFVTTYPRFEDAGAVTPDTFVNQAHNDYLEVAMEMGLVGVALILAGLAWYGLVTYDLWTRRNEDDLRLRKAASVALGVVLVHSFVDYPLRTEAIACIAAVCAVVMVAPRESRRAAARRAEPAGPQARHVEL